MNIFYLDEEPRKCAQYHCDKHVVKMILEYCQLLSTAHRVLDGVESFGLTSNGRKIKRWFMEDPIKELDLYKATHVNHPSAVWCRESSINYLWLHSLLANLMVEYKIRYNNKQHKCESKILKLGFPPINSPQIPMTSIPLCMPDKYKVECPIQSYRNFYINEKVAFARWKTGNIPNWFIENNFGE